MRVADLKFNGYHTDPYYSEKRVVDLRIWENCVKATRGMDEVYNLAANMGGIGFITETRAEVMRDNILINTHLLEASRKNGARKYLFSSSACVYPDYLQKHSKISGLREKDAYPANPDSFYGWEKLASEKVCEAYQKDFGMDIKIVRYHNIYGPEGTYAGGREKSPAALCRKVAEASNPGTIRIWGDGNQTRSYCYIDDAVRGTAMLLKSSYDKPVNIGSDRLISIDELADVIIKISKKTLRKEYDLDAPQGVRGRNADISIAKKALGWKPEVSLENGLAATYDWIERKCLEDMHIAPILTQVH